MKLVGKLYVQKGQYGFSTLIRNQEEKMYIQVVFKKDQEPNKEKAEINIKDGFLSMYKNQNGYAKPKIVVLDYDNAEETTVEETTTNEWLNDGLPF